jgi:hypothetical protein
MMTVICRMMGGLLVALLVLSATAGLGYAQQAEAPPAKTAPAKTPKLDAETLKIPDSVHDTQAKAIDKPRKTLPPQSAPNKVDLGAYDLEFRAKHSSDVNPRSGFDSGEKANLSNSTPGRKTDSALPNYFGLKLSAPTE